MRVFVTGATGFVGFHTVMALRAAGHEVRLGVRNAEKMQRLYAAHGVDIDDYAIGEITDTVSVSKALKGCDAVVHAAALVSNHPADAQLMQKTNVDGTRTVIGLAVEQGIESIIYISSAAALFDPDLRRIDESTPLAQATTAYARSKVDAESYVQGLIDAGASIAITYPAGVVGPDDPAMSEGNQSVVFILNNCHVNTSSGLQIIDVRELASAQVQLLERKLSGRFLVSGHYVTWRDYGEMLEEVTGKNLIKLPLPGPLMRSLGSLSDLVSKVYPLDTPVTAEAMEFATRWVINDDSHLRQTLGIRYRPLEETLRDTIRWLVDAGHIDQDWGDYLE